VAGRIRDIGQNVLQSSFQTGCSSSPIYFQIFFPIAVFEDALLINIIMTLRIHYTIIIISINNNNVIIIMEGSKTLFRSSKFPWAPERIPSTSTNNLSTTRPQKGSPGLAYSNPHQARFTTISSFLKFHITLCFRNSHLARRWGEVGRMVASASRMPLCLYTASHLPLRNVFEGHFYVDLP